MSSSNNSSHADDVLNRARRIVEESMRARQEHARRMAGYRHERSVVAEARRVPATRPVRPLDEEAFDVALGVWHRTYVHAYRPVVASDAREAHDEATRDALEAAIGCYEETRR